MSISVFIDLESSKEGLTSLSFPANAAFSGQFIGSLKPLLRLGGQTYAWLSLASGCRESDAWGRYGGLDKKMAGFLAEEAGLTACLTWP